MLVAALWTSSASAALRSPTLAQKLERKVSVTWQGQQLGVALERLTSTAQIALWFDRRVDRQQVLAIQLVDVPLVQALERIAQQQSLGFTRLDNLVYFGPLQSAQELPALIQQAHGQLAKTPKKRRRRWLKKEATTWPRLSEPRSLAESWLRATGVQLLGSEQIPHDLWPEQTLPPLARVDRLVLLLAGFDRTCKIATDGKTCEIVPISRPVQRTHQEPALKTKLPKKTRPRRSSRSTPHQRYTLRLENQPLGHILDQFARQLQLEIVWALDRKQQAREQLVSCDVQNVELDELLGKVLSPAGLKHQRQGKQITIETQP